MLQTAKLEYMVNVTSRMTEVMGFLLSFPLPKLLRDLLGFCMEEARKTEAVQLNVDFNFLREYMQKGGLVLEIVKYSQCGAPLHLPDSGAILKRPTAIDTHKGQIVVG